MNLSTKIKIDKKIIAILVLILVLILGGIMAVFIFAKKSKKNNIEISVKEIVKEEQKIEAKNVSQKTDYKKTVRDIENKKKNNQETTDDLIALGVSYYNLGDLDKAKKAYQDVLVKNSQSAYAYNNLANIFRDQGKYREAEANYRKAIELDSASINSYLNLAVMFFALEKNKTTAIQILNEGLIKNPGNQLLTQLKNEYSK